MAEQTLVYAPAREAARRAAEAEAAATIYTDGRRRVRATRMQSAVTRRGSIVTFRPTEVVDDVHRIALMESLGIDFVEVPSDGIVPTPRRCTPSAVHEQSLDDTGPEPSGGDDGEQTADETGSEDAGGGTDAQPWAPSPTPSSRRK